MVEHLIVRGPGIISITPVTLEEGPYSPPGEVKVVGDDRPHTPGSGFTIFDVNDVSQQVGSKFTLDSGPIFKQTVDFLTNGRDGLISVYLFDPHGGTGLGLYKWGLKPANYPGADLRGFTIEGLDLSIDSFTFPVENRPDPANAQAHITLVIRGTSPLISRIISRFGGIILGFVLGGLVALGVLWTLGG